MARTAKHSRGERRWIVLTEDGRHVTLGRHTDPTEAEIAAAEQALVAQSLHGWLAVTEGDYWAQRGRVSLLMVRPLGAPQVAFESAAAIFEALRSRVFHPV